MAKSDQIEKLEDLIKDTIEGELVEQNVVSLLPPGENYASLMKKVDFTVKKGKIIQKYHAVAKCTPPNPVTQNLINTQETFKAEIAWYTTVIPTLKAFAKEQGLRRELDFFQELYGARISLDPKSDKVDLNGVILTENLIMKGYYNIDRHQGFDAATTFSILRDLATFHAVPLALRLKNPTMYKNKLQPFCNKFQFKPMSLEEKAKFDKSSLEIFDHIPELEQYMDRVRKGINDSLAFGKRKLREPWITIMHLDFWCNNVMITGGENSKTMILDLQIPMEGSPVGDVILFLLTSINFDTIKERFDEFIKFYYNEFINNLAALNISTDNYPYEEFLEEIKIEAKSHEYAHSLSHTQIMLMEKGVTAFDASDADFKMDDFNKKKRPVNQRQIEKFRWITLEAIERNWI